MSTRTKSLFSMAYTTAESKITFMGYSGSWDEKRMRLRKGSME